MRFITPGASLVLIGGCGGSACLALPCAFPVAVELTVTSVAGAPIHNATLVATSPGSTTGPCDNQCVVGGGAGKYSITVSAPGFAPASLSVTVTGSGPKECGCESVDTQHIDVKLTPA
jgi:hypothetical protein